MDGHGRSSSDVRWSGGTRPKSDGRAFAVPHRRDTGDGWTDDVDGYVEHLELHAFDVARGWILVSSTHDQRTDSSKRSRRCRYAWREYLVAGREEPRRDGRV